ncbi:unnamed protein product [Amoebophrya sp. A25]|nr:unnamed protein product [Amoebophrya sp. A25]|eukprot:GSA25T00004326001.1
MGAGGSSTIEGSEAKGLGYRIFNLSRGSPAHAAGLQIYFDYICAVDGERVDGNQRPFYDRVKSKIGQSVKLTVFSSKSKKLREVVIIPSTSWGGKGLLGATIRFDTFDATEFKDIRVTHVFANSPAEMAGITAGEDFLLGGEGVLFRDLDDLIEFVGKFKGKCVSMYVYNVESDETRAVPIVPSDAWGGRGALGCEFGTGLFHRIPNPDRLTQKRNEQDTSATTEKSAAVPPKRKPKGSKNPNHIVVAQDGLSPDDEDHSPLLRKPDDTAQRLYSSEEEKNSKDSAAAPPAARTAEPGKVGGLIPPCPPPPRKKAATAASSSSRVEPTPDISTSSRATSSTSVPSSSSSSSSSTNYPEYAASEDRRAPPAQPQDATRQEGERNGREKEQSGSSPGVSDGESVTGSSPASESDVTGSSSCVTSPSNSKGSSHATSNSSPQYSAPSGSPTSPIIREHKREHLLGIPPPERRDDNRLHMRSDSEPKRSVSLPVDAPESDEDFNRELANRNGKGIPGNIRKEEESAQGAESAGSHEEDNAATESGRRGNAGNGGGSKPIDPSSSSADEVECLPELKDGQFRSVPPSADTKTGDQEAIVESRSRSTSGTSRSDQDQRPAGPPTEVIVLDAGSGIFGTLFRCFHREPRWAQEQFEQQPRSNSKTGTITPQRSVSFSFPPTYDSPPPKHVDYFLSQQGTTEQQHQAVQQAAQRLEAQKAEEPRAEVGAPASADQNANNHVDESRTSTEKESAAKESQNQQESHDRIEYVQPKMPHVKYQLDSSVNPSEPAQEFVAGMVGGVTVPPRGRTELPAVDLS